MSKFTLLAFASLWLVASTSSAQQLRLKQPSPTPPAATGQPAQKSKSATTVPVRRKAAQKTKTSASGASKMTGAAKGAAGGTQGQPGQASSGTQGQASGAGKMTGAAQGASASAAKPKGGIELLYPKGGEELVSGLSLDIKWKNAAGSHPVSLVLMVEHKYKQTLKIPIVLSRQAPVAGPFRYTLPVGFNSRDGWHYKVVLQQDQSRSESGYFSIYPDVDLRPVNIKIRNQKKHWALKALKAIATGGYGNIPGMTEAAAIRETVKYAKKDGKAISRKSAIVVEFDLENRGIRIPSGLMSKVTVRLTPGNAELNAGGFSHDRVIPGRKYRQKATIKAKDWDLAPGRYILEISVDPQNNANEPEALRANNVKTVEFRIN